MVPASPTPRHQNGLLLTQRMMQGAKRKCSNHNLQYVSSNSEGLIHSCGVSTISNFSQHRQASIGSGTTESTVMSDVNMEGMTSDQLLLLCASAIEQHNDSIVEQAVAELRKASSFNGEPSERVNAYFLQALLRRSAAEPPTSHEVQWGDTRCTLNELTRFVDLTPYFRFGYTAANGALLETFEGMDQIHILDFSTTHGMQWPTFIEALADREHGPPKFRLTLSSAALPVPPRLHTSHHDLGVRLANYARFKNVPFEFNILPHPLPLLSPSHIDLRQGEAFAVNFSLRLHYLDNETLTLDPSPRDKLLDLIRSLNPNLVTLYEDDCDATSPDVVLRLEHALASFWIPFDCVATFWPTDNADRRDYEANVGRRIENIVACEGGRRIERLEARQQWVRRMARMGFQGVATSEDVVAQLHDVVEHHRCGWGVKVDEDDCTQSLLWKGNSVAFASAWMPAR